MVFTAVSPMADQWNRKHEREIMYRSRMTLTVKETTLYKQHLSYLHHSQRRCPTRSMSRKGSEGTDTVQASVRNYTKLL